MQYGKANLKEITNTSKYINSGEQGLIYRLFKKHENVFDDALGKKLNHTMQNHFLFQQYMKTL